MLVLCLHCESPGRATHVGVLHPAQFLFTSVDSCAKVFLHKHPGTVLAEACAQCCHEGSNRVSHSPACWPQTGLVWPWNGQSCCRKTDSGKNWIKSAQCSTQIGNFRGSSHMGWENREWTLGTVQTGARTSGPTADGAKRREEKFKTNLQKAEMNTCHRFMQTVQAVNC